MKVPVLLPNIFDYPFTYTSKEYLIVGDYVEVPFGKKKMIGIVWNEFEDTWVDTDAKLPTISVPGKTPFQHLSSLVKDALIDHDLHTNKVYVDRANVNTELWDYQGAIDDYTKSIEIYPNKAYLYNYRAESKRKLGDNEGAYEDDKKADKLKNM